MLATLIRAWWDRLRGRLEPSPYPFSEASFLDSPTRSLVASPERVLGAFALAPGERVLEVGPGTGYYSVQAAERLRPSGHLICLDMQKEMLVETRRRLHAAHQGQTHCVQGDALAIPLRSASVDHVFLTGVLGEIPDRPRALAEFSRVLRPGGRLSVSEQLPDPDFIPRGTLRRELQAAGFVEASTRGHFWYTSTWTRSRHMNPNQAGKAA